MKFKESEKIPKGKSGVQKLPRTGESYIYYTTIYSGSLLTSSLHLFYLVSLSVMYVSLRLGIIYF